MVLQNLLSEVALVDVHIDFRGADVLVAEHCLNGPQIGSAFQKLCSEAVPESVGTDVLLDASFFRVILNIYEE